MSKGLLLDFILLCSHTARVCSTEFLSLTSAVANVSAGASGVLQYLPPYSIDGENSRNIPRLKARRFEMMPIRKAPNVKIGDEKRETAYKW